MPCNIDGKRKPIEQLRPQIAFFGIHRADEDEARRVAERDAFALDHVDAHRRRVEQQIDHVIVEQVHFVHVQQAAIRRSQHARLEAANALLNRLLDVERAHHAIFRGAHRQIDELRAALGVRQVLPVLGGALAAFRAPRRRLIGIAAEAAVLHHVDFGQQRRQRAGGGGLGRAALAANQHAADLRIDGVEHQRSFHSFLADDGRKGKNVAHD